MLKNLLRYGLIATICAGTIFSGEYAAQGMARHAAVEFYNSQGWTPDRDIQFSPLGLQSYTQQVASSASTSSTNARNLIWLLGAGLIAVVSAPSSVKAFDKTETLFQKWIEATKRNDSLEMARIETEVRDVGS